MDPTDSTDQPDPIANAVTIGRIATGEITEEEVAAKAAADRRRSPRTKRVKSLEDKT